ncbi:Lrp/AsnC family transcriptional regulator [uncultured Sphingomonas sp.]|uniref:Lrp/AsnC family transcriptional regulator n=1 Tax=unclassified Sphingomonas TaxID=196159 RepID=UPI0025EA78F7|nr:Lrp/AsnC family transcriptional regulator [uncultured Sphingomonas sp.]
MDEIDAFDRKIIAVLEKDGRLSVTELAKRVGLSKTPCQTRLKRLTDRGYIRGFKAVVDPEKLGLGHVAFTEVKLSDTREAALAEFRRGVLAIPQVEECHMIASSFDYLLKIRTSDIRQYRDVLGERISTLPHVASTSTFVVMETIREGGF